MMMFGSEMVAIVSVGLVLMIQTAVADFGSLDDFRATASKRPSMAQTQELLKRAWPGEKIGSVSAQDILKLDHIGIQYCNWQEINKRHELCAKKVVDMDLKSYCGARFEELVHFCADNLIQVVKLEIDQVDLIHGKYKRKAALDVQSLETIREDIKKVFVREGEWNYNDDFTPALCARFNRQFKAIKAILEYTGLEFLRMAKANGLVKLFEVREFCKAIPKTFRGADQEPDTDGI